jgi:hypothetical protein
MYGFCVSPPRRVLCVSYLTACISVHYIHTYIHTTSGSASDAEGINHSQLSICRSTAVGTEAETRDSCFVED